jgi:hypothetical protein
MAEEAQYWAGDFAVYRGDVYSTFGDIDSPRLSLIREHDDDPIPEGLQPKPEEPTRVFYATPDQLDAWYRSRWSFRWRDQPFDAIGSGEGYISGWFVGRDRHLVADHLQRVDRDGWLGRFPLDEVTGLTEHRTDLLAQWKEEHQR